MKQSQNGNLVVGPAVALAILGILGVLIIVVKADQDDSISLKPQETTQSRSDGYYPEYMAQDVANISPIDTSTWRKADIPKAWFTYS